MAFTCPPKFLLIHCLPHSVVHKLSHLAVLHSEQDKIPLACMISATILKLHSRIHALHRFCSFQPKISFVLNGHEGVTGFKLEKETH